MLKAYKLKLSPPAQKDLKRLPISIQKDIVLKHLPEIASRDDNLKMTHRDH
jgi:mRNA-degrading endonuclease RelE of RelBE toxin-antitoxin system